MSTNVAAADASTSPAMTSESKSHTSTSSAVASHVVPHIPIPSRGVDYRRKIVLAPMVRSGELPSRLVALHYNANLCWGPETVDRSMIGTIQSTNPRSGCIEWKRPQTSHAHNLVAEGEEKESVIYRIDPQREGSRHIFQIGTNSPERAVAAADLVAPFCAGIDVNAGCPKSFSTDGGMGAALLTEQKGDLLCDILRALVQQIGKKHEIGISVKIRILPIPEETSLLVKKLVQTGITGLTVHCRTRPMRPRERAIRDQLRMIREICHAHGVACLMNGDVVSRDDGLRLMAEYGVDGAMIATAAEANPSVFLSDEQGGKKHWREIVTLYMREAIRVENRFGNTKFSLSQLMPGKDRAYQMVVQSKTYASVLEALDLKRDTELFESARKLDSLLGLDAPKLSRTELKKANKAANRAKNEANIAAKKKRMAEGTTEHEQRDTKRERKASPRRTPGREHGLDTARSPVQKAKDAAENAGFDIGYGALQVAV